MLIEQLKTNLGKSAHGGQTLYDHLFDCEKVAYRILTDRKFVPSGYQRQRIDQLLFATFVHDIGKLDPDFQAMLMAAREGRRLPAKRVKHEASTLAFEEVLRSSEEEIRVHLAQCLGYSFSGPIDIEDVLTFSLSHHGLFYRNGLSTREQPGHAAG